MSTFKNKFQMEVPPAAIDIIQQLENDGYETYVVGGCVRDSVLNKIPHDYDMCTSAVPQQMKDVFSKTKQRTYDTGIQHGTISIKGKDRQLYEVTVFRIDGDYTDGRHPDSVQFVSDVNKDLARRDFTINAMAYSPTRGLVDPFGGQADCENKIIRCVGDPNKRFQEDGLRIMRAIRFAATYGFEIEEQTKRAIHENKHLLRNVSMERKTSEFVKMLVKADAQLLLEYKDVFAEFIPEIKPMFDFNQKSPWHNYDVFEHTARAVELVPPDPTLKLAAFFHDIGKPYTFYTDLTGRGHFQLHQEKGAELAEQIMKTMRFDNHSVRDVTTLIKYHDEPLTHNMDRINMKCMMRQIGEGYLRLLVPLQQADKQAQRGVREELEKMDRAAMSYEDAAILGQLRALDKYESVIDSIVQSNEPYLIPHLKVNGHDLMDIGYTGKDIKECLSSLLDTVIEHPELNHKDKLLDIAQKNMSQLLCENEEIERS